MDESPIHDGYSVEPLRRDLFPELRPLMLDAFGDTVSTAYFDWKYLENPSGEAIGQIARFVEDGTIAAFYGMIPETYLFASRARRVYQSCDTMTHSRHRRKGLFKTLALKTYQNALAADEAFLAFGFGGPTSTPGFLKMGWRIEFEIPHLFCPFPLTILPILGADAARVESSEALDEALIDLLIRSAGLPNSVDKNERFVRWRLANPQRRYHYLRDGDRAYAIYYRAGGFIFLFDFWEAGDGEGRNVIAALRRKSLKPRSKGILTVCQEGTQLARQLRDSGFWRNPFGRGPASARTPFITFNAGQLGAGDWSITPFDHDSY